MVETKKLETPPNIFDAVSDEITAKIYVNGFAAFRSNADMGVVFQTNGRPSAVVNMSFTLAKTLAEKLSQMVIDFEQSTGTEIMTTSVVDKKTSPKKAKNPDEVH